MMGQFRKSFGPGEAGDERHDGCRIGKAACGRDGRFEVLGKATVVGFPAQQQVSDRRVRGLHDGLPIAESQQSDCRACANGSGFGLQ